MTGYMVSESSLQPASAEVCIVPAAPRCRHTTVVVAMACALALAAITWSGSLEGSLPSRQNLAIASSLVEKYVNECDLFGCHTELRGTARSPPPRIAERDSYHESYHDSYHEQSLSFLQKGEAKRRENKNVEARLETANAKLASLAASLVAENETAIDAFNTTLDLENEMQHVERQTHLDRVKIRTEQGLLKKDEELLHEERWHRSAEKKAEHIREHIWGTRLAHAEKVASNAEKVASNEKRELFNARNRLRLSSEAQAKALAEAHQYAIALRGATERLVNYKKSVGEKELKLQGELTRDEKLVQKQMMEEQNNAQQSDQETIDTLTAEVVRLNEALKQREAVIQLQQNVIKVQAKEVQQLEATAEKQAKSASKTLNNIMKGAEAASDAAKAGKDPVVYAPHDTPHAPSTFPSFGIDKMFGATAPPPAAVPVDDNSNAANVPKPEDWRNFGRDIFKNPGVQVVGKSGVVDDRNFAAGVKGAYGTKTPEEEEKALQAAEQQKQSAEQQEAKFAEDDARQKEAQEAFLMKHASNEEKASFEQKKNEEAFAKMMNDRPPPDMSRSFDDIMAESARARREAEQQMRAKQIENEVAAQRMAEKSAAADELLRKASKPISPPIKFGGVPTDTSSHLKVTTIDSLHSSESGQSELPSLPSLQPLTYSGIAGETTPTETGSDVKTSSSAIKSTTAAFDYMKNAASNAGGAVASAAQSIFAAKIFPSLANPGKYTSSESAAALTAKAAGIASFIVAHPPPAEGHFKSKPGEMTPAKEAAMISREPEDAELPLSKSAAGSASTTISDPEIRLAPAKTKEDSDASDVSDALDVSVKPHRDTIQDDLALASKQLNSYDFLTGEKEATLPDINVVESQKARDQVVAKQMDALVRQERKSDRLSWGESGLRVEGKGKAAAREQTLVELPADMVGEHPGKAQQSVKDALQKEEEFARARVEAAKKAASATRKAEHLAEEEVQRLNRLEEIQKGLEQSKRTNNIETKIQRSKHAAYSTHADAPVQQMASFGGGTAISPDAAGAERAKQPLHVQPIQGADEEKRGVVWAEKADMPRAKGDTASSAIAAVVHDDSRPHLRSGVKSAMQKEEKTLRIEVGGPIKSHLAKQIVDDLAQLDKMMTRVPKSQSQGFRNVGDDVSMDAKAAMQDLAQLDKSQKVFMNPSPLKFAVKVPAGGVPGRRMEVHLPDGRTEMLIIPPHVKAGQMVEVDAPGPFTL